MMVPTKLSSVELAQSVVFATAKWNDMEHRGEQEYREELLKSTDWRAMIEQGSQVTRFMNTQGSAWEIIDAVLQRKSLDLHVVLGELARIHGILPKESNAFLDGFFSYLFGVVRIVRFHSARTRRKHPCRNGEWC